MELPNVLTIEIEAADGAERIDLGTAERFPLYRAFWCEECKRYCLWPGPDWGASHYFCDDCLEKLELFQNEDDDFSHNSVKSLTVPGPKP